MVFDLTTAGTGGDPIASDADRPVGVQDPGTGDNLVRPFQIEASQTRGRLVRLGSVLHEITAAHAYPPPLAHLLGEAIVMAALLASALKYEGVFTLQTKGDGPVSFLVVDVTTGGDIRGFAQVREGRLPEVEALATEQATIPALLGQGHLAFTVDQGEYTDRYQGIVALEGETLTDCLSHYFSQSEQIPAAFQVAVRQEAGKWRGGGLMIQRLPDQERILPLHDRDENWNRAVIMLQSATEAELVAPEIGVDRLLFRLFHEDGVRVFEPLILSKGCRCSRDRIERVLRQVPRAELEELKVDGRVEVTCEFCNITYLFDDGDLEELEGEAATRESGTAH